MTKQPSPSQPHSPSPEAQPDATAPARPLKGREVTLRTLAAVFWPQIGATWAMTLVEVGVLALVPLLIGDAIDGLLAGTTTAFMALGGALFGLIVVGAVRRVYDTRAYGTIRVELGYALAARGAALPVSTLSARLRMGRELVDFLESEAPEALTATIRTMAALVILWRFHAALALSAMAAFGLMVAVYAVFNRRFFALNAALNTHAEAHVEILRARVLPRLRTHLHALRRSEVRLSDTEALVYGVIFTVLVAFVMGNVWFATRELTVSAGQVFAIVTYSWDFVESALVLPMVLQSLSRLGEITTRLARAPAGDGMESQS